MAEEQILDQPFAAFGAAPRGGGGICHSAINMFKEDAFAVIRAEMGKHVNEWGWTAIGTFSLAVGVLLFLGMLLGALISALVARRRLKTEGV